MANSLTPKEYIENWSPVTAIQPWKTNLRPSVTCEKLLQANAATTIATLLGSTNGYIGLVCNAAAYNIIAPGTPLNHPVTPNAKPDLPARANQTLVGTLICAHEESKHVFIKCTNIKKALKLQVKQAVKLPYLSGIRNCTTGFANVSLIAMLNHLFTTYNTITSMQLDANNTEMLKEWDPNMPVELLFTQIEEGLKKALKLQVKQVGELPYLSGVFAIVPLDLPMCPLLLCSTTSLPPTTPLLCFMQLDANKYRNVERMGSQHASRAPLYTN